MPVLVMVDNTLTNAIRLFVDLSTYHIYKCSDNKVLLTFDILSLDTFLSKMFFIIINAIMA